MNRLLKIVKAIVAFLIRSVKDPLGRVCRYLSNKIRFWGLAQFNSSVRISAESTFEGANRLGNYSYFSGNMGYGTYICNNCHIEGNIGRFCSVAPEVCNSLGVHPIGEPYVSTSPMFYSLLKQTGVTFAKKQLFDELRDPIEIGHDCWIGQRVFIVGGVKIGTGAVVMAGAVVTKNVPPYAIVGGVPAKVLRFRYDVETIEFLLKTEWWNRPIEWIMDNYEIFCDINKFKSDINETICNNS